MGYCKLQKNFTTELFTETLFFFRFYILYDFHTHISCICLLELCCFCYKVADWQIVYDSPAPQTAEYIAPWNQLNDMQKLIVLRLLRPDKVSESFS